MRISDLAATTGATVATLKFYLRRGILHPGTAVSRTLAEYDDGHVDRVRLIRALTEVGGLDLASVERVLGVVDGGGDDRLGVLATAQRALDGGDDDGIGSDDMGDPANARSRDWLAARGWQVEPDDPQVRRLEQAWRACDDAGIGVDEARMDAYADAVESIARTDVASVPAEPTAAVRQVVLGTVLVDPVLVALRRLAHQHLSVTAARDGGESQS